MFCVRWAILPNSVSMPMRVTTARPFPSETEVPAKMRLGVGLGEVVLEHGVGRLAHGVGLARERGLVHLQVRGAHHAGVRGDLVALGKHHDVAGDEVLRQDLLLLPVADDARVGRQHLLERVGGLAGAYSCQKLKHPLMTFTSHTATPSSGSPATKAMMPAAHSRMAMRCVKFDRNASTGDFFFSVWMRFLPCLAWRALGLGLREARA